MAAVIFQPNVSAVTSFLTTELNALANATASVAGPAFNNTPTVGGANGYDTADIELVAGWGSAPTLNKTVDLYIIQQTDGANYSDTAGPPPNGYLGAFVCQVGTAQRLALRGVPIPPMNFKLLAVNNSGVAFSATANTVKALMYNRQAN